MQRTIRYQGAIIRDDHILLIQHRHYATGRSYWLLPGSGLEGAETPEACVQHEVREETLWWLLRSSAPKIRRMKQVAITVLHTPSRTPQANASCERSTLWVPNRVHRECGTHMLMVSDVHLRRVLTAYGSSVTRSRPHQGSTHRVPAGGCSRARSERHGEHNSRFSSGRAIMRIER